MAPPLHPFPLSELPERAQYTTANFKEKSRKIRNFNLENCELYELVQFSCTTMRQQMEKTISGQSTRMECRPFVRLFRECRQGNKVFHVETTAWEGEHQWTPRADIASRPESKGVRYPRSSDENSSRGNDLSKKS